MTKALEAAIARAHEIGWSRFGEADVREIIRAFAANVTEEMAAECSGEIWNPAEFDHAGCEHTWEAKPEQIRAAIERGLV